MADTQALATQDHDQDQGVDHALFTFKKIRQRLLHLSKGMKVETRGPLIGALDRLSCIPFFSFSVSRWLDLRFFIRGEDAGTLLYPNLDVIKKHSKPSPFGRGEETVLDETYRRGEEVTKADLEFPNEWQYKEFVSQLESVASATLFVPMKAKVKFHKLAVYSEGGHFDWHVDTTNSHSHHATMLVALNTSWTGGDFILRRDGVETPIDMKPKNICRHPYRELGAVAFYTDTEHKVEPVTDGIRIVLQFDVEMDIWGTRKEALDTSVSDEHVHKKTKTTHRLDDDENERGWDDEAKKNEYQGGGSRLQSLGEFFRDRKGVLPESVPEGDPEVIDDIVKAIKRLLTKKDAQEEVAFALQYLYRKSSILPAYLKGSDSLLYQTLSKTFHVELQPIVLYESTDGEGFYQREHSEFAAFVFPDSVDEELGDDDEDSDPRYSMKGENREKVFYLPRSSAVQHISRQDYVEYAGNDAILGEGRYFGAGMFVTSKDD